MNYEYAGNKKWNVYDGGNLVATVETKQGERLDEYAALFAAAPDLLDACEAVLDAMTDPNFDDYFDGAKLELMLQAVVDKARGEG